MRGKESNACERKVYIWMLASYCNYTSALCGCLSAESAIFEDSNRLNLNIVMNAKGTAKNYRWYHGYLMVLKVSLV
jgi:hypothetical protein